MDFASLMLEHGETLQYVLFFGSLPLFFALEWLLPRRKTASDRRHRWPTNIGITATNVVALGFVPVSFIGAALWAQSMSFGLFNRIELPLWLLLPAALLLRGLISTVTHLLNHKIPWLWRFHRVHHLDTELDVSTTFRAHPVEFFYGPFIGIPMVVVFGLPAWILAFYELIDVIINLCSHSNLRIPAKLNRFLRYLIVTPDLHRIHHSSWQPETDSNFGAVFPVWDMIFGTFRPESRDPQEDMQLGLAEFRGPESSQYLKLLVSPLWRDNLRGDQVVAPSES